MSDGRFRTDVDVFAMARRILPEAGYVTETVTLQEESVLLAENAYSLIALAATATIEDLFVAEPLVEALLQTRIEGVDVGPKLWDAYVVLLTREVAGEDGRGLRPLFSINYDTRGFRRIARVGVEATVRGVRNALAPFVEPIQLEHMTVLADPLRIMSTVLVNHGVEESLAIRSIEIFKQGGNLDDVI